MAVEVVEFAPGRPLADLGAALEAQGGSLVVTSWRPGMPTVANVVVPDDAGRRAACRCLIDEWLAPAPEGDAVLEGSSWPLGHPRHQFGLRAG